MSNPHPTESPRPRSKLVGAAVGGALVVALLGGVIGGIIATQPHTATPAPSPTMPEQAPEPLTGAGAEESPEPGSPEPQPTEPQPTEPEVAASEEPAPEPEPSPSVEATTSAPGPTASRRASTRPGSRVDPTWLSQVSGSTGVPRRALEAYAVATLTLQRENPSCSLGWNTLAAIGQIESRHGTYGGAKLGEDGVASPRILGPALDGNGFASIRDTDGGVLDGDTTWDRAVGPMQFIPSTWRAYGADGNGDGVKDPHNIDDAALAAARYLCARGGMGSAGGWRSAVLGYNRSESYISQVAQVANRYYEAVG